MEPKQKRLTEGQRRKMTRNKQENMLFCCMCFWGCVMLIGTLIELVCKFFNIDNYNNCDTNENGYFKIRYQSLDRFSPTSQYQVVGSTLQKNWKGFIYNVDGNGTPTDSIPSGYNQRLTFGTPFFFYFGVVKGSSAFDKFRTKYINDELI